MGEIEAGEKVKQACIEELERCSRMSGEKLIGCILWDAAIRLREAISVKDVITNG